MGVTSWLCLTWIAGRVLVECGVVWRQCSWIKRKKVSVAFIKGGDTTIICVFIQHSKAVHLRGDEWHFLIPCLIRHYWKKIFTASAYPKTPKTSATRHIPFSVILVRNGLSMINSFPFLLIRQQLWRPLDSNLVLI